MPNLVRKLAVSASENGLDLQSHGSENHQILKIEYRTRKLTVLGKGDQNLLKQKPHLEAYGIIGFLSISSHSFLIAITRREQVGQIYGKPVYVVADVAILPLSSQAEASRAIETASHDRNKDGDLSESEFTDSEDDDPSAPNLEPPEPPEPLESPDEEAIVPFTRRNRSDSSIAENVAKRRGSYGKFASRWFFRRVWGTNRAPGGSGGVSKSAELSHKQQENQARDAAEVSKTSDESAALKTSTDASPGPVTNASATSLLPKILRSTKMILSSRSYYFAYDFDLTRRFSLQSSRSIPISHDSIDPLFFWNRRIGSAFFDAGHEAFLTPIVQGFFGQRNFSVTLKDAAQAAEDVSETTNAITAVKHGGTDAEHEQSYLLTVISRRSVKRSGLRYLRRGIDDEGNCANTVETEQILSSPTWDSNTKIRSFVQVRGSIPLYFSQSPYSFKPVPMMHNSPAANQTAFRRHFQSLRDQYGAIQIAMLVDKHGNEVSIGSTYEKTYKELHDAGQLSDVAFEWFDFHSECRGMKFENVQRLVDKFRDEMATWGETVIVDNLIQTKQSGVIRTNCMDCLDRTNVAQSAFGQHVLQRDLEQEGYAIDLLNDENTNWFNTLWADNGDAISRQYASTAALKGDFTRTRKRNWRGQMNDLGLTLSRYYSNMVNDYFSQAVIDVLLGNVSWKVFEDFESSMMSEDPGVSVETARQAAIENCAKIVIQGEDEDLIQGWTMLTPAHENTLRTLPFEEAVVLLTDVAVYCCKFDWNTEKVASFEKVDLRSISKVRLGTYVTSTFTERQLDERLNQGIVIIFTPGTDDVIRVNTRSLRNSISLDTPTQSSGDGGNGILSWFAPKAATEKPRTLALKVIPRNTRVEGDGGADQPNEPADEVAARIGEEIQRAVVGPRHMQDYPEFIERGDIISAAEAKRRTGYIEQLGQSLRKMVWT